MNTIFNPRKKSYWFRLIIALLFAVSAPFVPSAVFWVAYYSGTSPITYIIGGLYLLLYFPVAVFLFLFKSAINELSVWSMIAMGVTVFIYQYFFSVLYIKLWGLVVAKTRRLMVKYAIQQYDVKRALLYALSLVPVFYAVTYSEFFLVSLGLVGRGVGLMFMLASIIFYGPGALLLFGMLLLGLYEISYWLFSIAVILTFFYYFPAKKLYQKKVR